MNPSSRDAQGVSAATRHEQMATVAEIAAASAELLADWANGSVQRTRTEDCGDSSCGYASCRLANAIHAYNAIADKESSDV